MELHIAVNDGDSDDDYRRGYQIHKKALGEGGIRQIWHKTKLRGGGCSRVGEILQYAKTSVGIEDGVDAAKTTVNWFVWKIVELEAELAVKEGQINQKCQEISQAGIILEILGIGENTLSGILAEMGIF